MTDGTRYVLTQEEHEKCLAGAKDGRPITPLRGTGDEGIIINMNALSSSGPTSDLTDLQILQNKEVKKIEGPAAKPISRKRRLELHMATYKKMGWDHDRPRCLCKNLGRSG